MPPLNDLSGSNKGKGIAFKASPDEKFLSTDISSEERPCSVPSIKACHFAKIGRFEATSASIYTVASSFTVLFDVFNAALAYPAVRSTLLITTLAVFDFVPALSETFTDIE
jgi:hypothetical protein